MREFALEQKIKPLHTALVIIDIQRDFCAPDGVLARRGRDVSGVDAVVDRILSLIELAKGQSIWTIYTQQIYDREQLNARQLEQYDVDGKLVTCDIATTGFQFYRLDPPAECVYQKYNYNIFSNSRLLTDLDDHGIKTLVIAGADTAYCVETAIRNGFDLGYKIVVAEDLLIGNTKHPDLNRRTLDLVEKTYGVVTTSRELRRMWTEV